VTTSRSISCSHRGDLGGTNDHGEGGTGVVSPRLPRSFRTRPSAPFSYKGAAAANRPRLPAGSGGGTTVRGIRPDPRTPLQAGAFLVESRCSVSRATCGAHGRGVPLARFVAAPPGPRPTWLASVRVWGPGRVWQGASRAWGSGLR
jgi:hypothetical protein